MAAQQQACTNVALRRLVFRPAHASFRETAVHSRFGIYCACVAIAVSLARPSDARSAETNGEIALASQLIDRGLATTPEVPILQGVLSLASPQTWSLSLSAGAELHASSASLAETTAQASRYWSLSSDWQMQASVLYFDYADTSRTKRSNRAELGTYWTYRDVLTIGLAADHSYGTRGGAFQGAGDVNFHWPLSPHISLSMGGGLARYLFAPYRSFRNPDAGADRLRCYRYGQAGLVGSWDAWRIEIDRVATAGVPPSQPGSLHTAPWLATISRLF